MFDDYENHHQNQRLCDSSSCPTSGNAISYSTAASNHSFTIKQEPESENLIDLTLSYHNEGKQDNCSAGILNINENNFHQVSDLLMKDNYEQFGERQSDGRLHGSTSDICSVGNDLGLTRKRKRANFNHNNNYTNPTIITNAAPIKSRRRNSAQTYEELQVRKNF